MSLVPYDPFRQLSDMRKEFDHFFSSFPSFVGTENPFGHIRVDVHETEKEMIAACDIPGLEKREDVNIDIENNILTISGSINSSDETNEKNVHRRERFYGHFHRTVSLPSPVSEEGVTASYRNGVLEVRMPKINNEKRRKIDVEFH